MPLLFDQSLPVPGSRIAKRYSPFNEILNSWRSLEGEAALRGLAVGEAEELALALDLSRTPSTILCPMIGHGFPFCEMGMVMTSASSLKSLTFRSKWKPDGKGLGRLSLATGIRTATICWPFPVKHCPFSSFKPCHAKREMLWLPTFYGWITWGKKKLSNLPKSHSQSGFRSLALVYHTLLGIQGQHQLSVGSYMSQDPVFSMLSPLTWDSNTICTSPKNSNQIIITNKYCWVSILSYPYKNNAKG